LLANCGDWDFLAQGSGFHARATGAREHGRTGAGIRHSDCRPLRRSARRTVGRNRPRPRPLDRPCGADEGGAGAPHSALGHRLSRCCASRQSSRMAPVWCSSAPNATCRCRTWR
jgi:hypothetical protein